MRRLLSAALGSAVVALLLLLVNPLPTDVLGQTTPAGQPASAALAPGGSSTIGGVTVANQSNQPINATVQGNTLTLAAPAGFTIQVAGASCTPMAGQPNVVTCSVAPGATVTVLGVSRQPGAAAPAGAAPPAVSAQPAAAQRTAQPAALPRTGAGLATDGSTGAELAAYGLLTLAAALGAAALVLRLRRAGI